MFLSCALGLAAISWSFDAMAVNKCTLRCVDVKRMDEQMQCIHHVAKSGHNLFDSTNKISPVINLFEGELLNKG